ncbi:MAG TPA: hypothetical protein VMT19_13235 [Thermoanaerobaculaceae bacterium]|nr:hypothetical protein [Thermoanaerobaculaceae bacterium]
MRLAARLASLVCLAALASSTACLTNARITNLDDDSCRSTLTSAISTILVGQRELPELADLLAADAVQAMAPTGPPYRPFTVSSPSGTDYTFVFRLKKDGCLLRLWGRARGSWVYTNDLTYIATEPLPGCRCVAGVSLMSRQNVGVHLR